MFTKKRQGLSGKQKGEKKKQERCMRTGEHICWKYNIGIPDWMQEAKRKMDEKDMRGKSVAWSAGILRNGRWNLSEKEVLEYIDRLPNAFNQEHIQIRRGQPPRKYFSLEYVRILNERFAEEFGIEDMER